MSDSIKRLKQLLRQRDVLPWSYLASDLGNSWGEWPVYVRVGWLDIQRRSGLLDGSLRKSIGDRLGLSPSDPATIGAWVEMMQQWEQMDKLAVVEKNLRHSLSRRLRRSITRSAARLWDPSVAWESEWSRLNISVFVERQAREFEVIMVATTCDKHWLHLKSLQGACRTAKKSDNTWTESEITYVAFLCQYFAHLARRAFSNAVKTMLRNHFIKEVMQVPPSEKRVWRAFESMSATSVAVPRREGLINRRLRLS